jgi:hypothetical protein
MAGNSTPISVLMAATLLFLSVLPIFVNAQTVSFQKAPSFAVGSHRSPPASTYSASRSRSARRGLERVVYAARLPPAAIQPTPLRSTAEAPAQRSTIGARR